MCNIIHQHLLLIGSSWVGPSPFMPICPSSQPSWEDGIVLVSVVSCNPLASVWHMSIKTNKINTDTYNWEHIKHISNPFKVAKVGKKDEEWFASASGIKRISLICQIKQIYSVSCCTTVWAMRYSPSQNSGSNFLNLLQGRQYLPRFLQAWRQYSSKLKKKYMQKVSQKHDWLWYKRNRWLLHFRHCHDWQDINMMLYLQVFLIL